MEVFSLLKMPQEQVPVAWPVFSQLLIQTEELWVEDETLQSIYESLVSGRYQVWTLVDDDRIAHFSLLTRVIGRPTGPVLEIFWAAGSESAKAVMSIEGLERAAAAQGCRKVRVLGRKGWLKLLGEYGYSPEYYVIAKVVQELGKGN